MKIRSRDIVLVGLQLCLFILYFTDFAVLRVSDLGIVSVAGLIIAAAGAIIMVVSLLQLNKNLSPFPTPREGSKLIKNGLYQYMRHPIYTGILFTAFGIAIHLGSVYKIIIGVLLFLLFDVKVRYEEQLLRQKYKEYDAYMKSTGRFLPR
jgi:protein-S-isoprenylcysteine O-methyltransferase Ste14